MGDDPELAARMVNDGDGVFLGGADGPTSAEEIDVMIFVAATAEMEGEMEVEKAGTRTRQKGVGVFL